ncbi:MAG: antibiotic biosynthesis monooxygenase [Planctomycetota bacterium]|nr:MAG: antibiotic biosynthesis monooxygenase [Planctomycetota bacterium]
MRFKTSITYKNIGICQNHGQVQSASKRRWKRKLNVSWTPAAAPTGFPPCNPSVWPIHKTQPKLAVSKLTIVANIHANSEKIELVKAELEKLIPITRAEKGCIQYDLHQDNENPAHFLFFENWESRDLWQDHMNAPHLAAFLKATEGAVAELAIHEMSHIG